MDPANPTPMPGIASTARSAGRPRAARAFPRLEGAGARRSLTAAVVLVALAIGFLALRDSSLVRVDEVTVTGISANRQDEVHAALEAAASRMTTLHVDEARLRAAVAPFASVKALEVDARFPHKLAIDVVERPIVGLVVVGGQRIPVAQGGMLLRDVRPEGVLPTLTLPTVPTGPQLTQRRARAAVAILAGAPGELRSRIRRVRTGGRGLQLDLRDGPALIFGSDARVAAKWAAATRVLADPDAQGATYLDVRVPERSAAGGVGPIGADDGSVPAPTDPDAPTDPTATPVVPAPTVTANPLP